MLKKNLHYIKNSIRIKLTMVLTGLVLLLVVLIWFMNLTFYPKYYRSTKINVLKSTYTYAQILMQSAGNDEAFLTALAQQSENNSISVYILTVNEYNSTGSSVYPVYRYPQYLSNYTKAEVTEKFNKLYTYDGSDSNVSQLESEQYSQIYETYDESIKSKYIELIGYLNNDNIIYLRVNIQGMQNSVNNTNTFLIYVGILVIVIGIILMLFISKRFTDPILTLAEISQKMSDLNFDVKYEGNNEDEIGRLGSSINTLSTRLESTISELKTANNELKLDNERKTQIDEMRKEFLSNVSHELKTPIALIQGYAEGLYDNINDDPESKDFYCEVIIDEARKMNKMVKKLLTLNQIEFGNNFVQIEHFDIVQMMSSVLNSTAILFEQKEVRLEINYPDSLFVWSDEYLTEEVFTNFVSNALNHIDGEKIVKVWTDIKEDTVRIFVSNTGHCIPDEELEKIWIKFYKVDKARTREYGGNGIGLSIVSAIMKSLNKEYGVYNTEDGVVFWFDVDIRNA